MKRALLIFTAVLLCLCLSCCNASDPSATVDIPAPNDVENLDGTKGYKRIELVRVEEIIDDSCFVIFPWTTEKEHEEIGKTIRSKVIAKMRELDTSAYSSFHIKLNSCGVFSVMMEFFSIETDELIYRLPLNFSTVTNKLITIADCFGKDEELWRTYISEIIEYQAEDRRMVLLSPICSIDDQQLFYITGRSLVLMYRPYEITTATELWPEFYVSLPSVSHICGDGSILKRVSELYESSINSESEQSMGFTVEKEYGNKNFAHNIYDNEIIKEMADAD